MCTAATSSGLDGLMNMMWSYLSLHVSGSQTHAEKANAGKSLCKFQISHNTRKYLQVTNPAGAEEILF